MPCIKSCVRLKPSHENQNYKFASMGWEIERFPAVSQVQITRQLHPGSPAFRPDRGV